MDSNSSSTAAPAPVIPRKIGCPHDGHHLIPRVPPPGGPTSNPRSLRHFGPLNQWTAPARPTSFTPMARTAANTRPGPTTPSPQKLAPVDPCPTAPGPGSEPGSRTASAPAHSSKPDHHRMIINSRAETDRLMMWYTNKVKAIGRESDPVIRQSRSEKLDQRMAGLRRMEAGFHRTVSHQATRIMQATAAHVSPLPRGAFLVPSHRRCAGRPSTAPSWAHSGGCSACYGMGTRRQRSIWPRPFSPPRSNHT